MSETETLGQIEDTRSDLLKAVSDLRSCIQIGEDGKRCAEGFLGTTVERNGMVYNAVYFCSCRKLVNELAIKLKRLGKSYVKGGEDTYPGGLVPDSATRFYKEAIHEPVSLYKLDAFRSQWSESVKTGTHFDSQAFLEQVAEEETA